MRLNTNQVAESPAGDYFTLQLRCWKSSAREYWEAMRRIGADVTNEGWIEARAVAGLSFPVYLADELDRMFYNRSLNCTNWLRRDVVVTMN